MHKWYCIVILIIDLKRIAASTYMYISNDCNNYGSLIYCVIPMVTLQSMSGRRQNSTSVTKRRKVRGRESGSSSNGELSNADRTQRQQQQQQQQQQRQQLQQRQTVSPPTVAPLPVVNPASSRPTAVSVPWRPMDDGGDQVSPASPITSRRITKANLHISEQMPESLDPTIHHQVISLPKEAFRLNNTDFIW